MKKFLFLSSALLIVILAVLIGCDQENPVGVTEEQLLSDGISESEEDVDINFSYPNYCFYLDVPWMSQLPPGSNWNLTNNCGQAVCVMLGGYFNNGSVASWVIDAENDWLGCSKPYGCTTGATTLQNLLSGFHGLRSEYHIGNEPDDVVAEGTRGRPVIVGVRTYMSATGGRPHWMLFVGWDGTYMYFHDPGRVKAEDGKFVRYTVGQFKSSWSNQGKKYIPVYK